jgi:hypothetical protein
MMRHQRFLSLLFAVAVPCSLLASDKPPAKVSLLYVQSAGSGIFEPVAGSSTRFRLVLNDVAPSVVYFSDRPTRLAGQLSMAEFLKGIGFGGDRDPNAAIDIEGAPAENDLVVAALSKPAYDAQSKTLSYEITVLKTAGRALASFSKRMDTGLPPRFGAVALFIDDGGCGGDQTVCGSTGHLPAPDNNFITFAQKICCPGFACTGFKGGTSLRCAPRRP